ncbi:MAG: hypothetical protein NTV34_04180, partial [Proteobacteria bacterium]|nr:hypothetical protein [Pseudomonadota bacterium]
MVFGHKSHSKNYLLHFAVPQRVTVVMALACSLGLGACQEKKKTGTASDGVAAYYHPTASGDPSGATTSAPKTISKALSLTTDVVLETGTTKVTIPAGAVRVEGTAVLKSFSGTFVNALAVRMVSESLALVMTKTDKTEFSASEIYRDIVIEQRTGAKSNSAKLVGLFAENADLATVSKKAVTKDRLTDARSDLGGGIYKVIQKVRLGRLGFVLAETTSGDMPQGFNAFVSPAQDPSVIAGTASTPSDALITWSGDPRFNSSYGLVYWADGEDEMDCTYSNAITATTISSGAKTSDYSYEVTALTDDTTYTFKFCGLSSRSPADSSGGLTVDVVMPARALAVLTNGPSSPSNTTALNITVAGAGVTHYKYAVLTNTSTCTGATLTDWTSVATPITDAIAQVTDDTVRVCVYGKIDASNIQLVATEVTWVVDKTPPVFTSLTLAAPALDGYLSAADRLVNTAIAGTLTASGLVVPLVGYSVVATATTCNAALTYSTTAPQADTTSITVDGVYKICVSLVDVALNHTYGASATFTVDTAIGFSAVALANDAADGYLNLAESLLTNAVVAAASGTSYTSRKYVVAAWATTCNAALTYSGTIPIDTNVGFSGDGDFKVCVEMSDTAGNKAYGQSAVIHRKVALPGFTSIALANSVADTYLNTADHLLTSALSGIAVGTNYDTLQYAVMLDASACSGAGAWSGSIPQANDAGIAVDGSQYKVCAKFFDNAGNPPVYGATLAFTYDTTSPVFTSLSLVNGAVDNYLNSTEVTAAANVHGVVSGSGFSAEAYSVAPSASACNGILTYLASIKQSNDVALVSGSTYKICARVSDAAGNLTYGASDNITVSIATPDCTAISLANDAVDLWVNAAERSSTSSLSSAASTTLSSPVKTYAVITSATACDAGVMFGTQDVMPASNDGSLVDSATYKVCAKVTDLAMNTPAYCATGAFTVDTTPPMFTSLPLIDTLADSLLSISEHSLTTDIAGPLDASGQSAVAYAVVSSGTTCGILLTYSGTMPKADLALLGTSGTYKVCVQLLDVAGNSTYDNSNNFDSDQIAPAFTSLALANEAFGGFINLAESLSVLASADTLIASGQTTTEYGYQTSAGACSAAIYAGAAPTVAAVGGLGDGTYKVCTRLTDVAGNITYGVTSSVVVDVTPPAFTAVNLANDGADTYINAAERSSTSGLVTAATGTGHDGSYYALVTNGTVCSGVVSWLSSIPLSNSGSFAGDGDYVVCVKLTDFAGNPDSFGSSSAIHLKTDFPVFTSIDLAGDVVDALLNLSEHSLTNDLATNLMGSDYVSSAYKLAAQAAACDVNLAYAAMPLSNDSGISGAGNFKVCVALTDVAGNITYGPSSLFEYDPTAPVFTSLALANDVLDFWLNSAEHALTSDLGGSLVASGQTTSTYAVVTSATNCDVGVTYGAMPKADDGAITDGGTWKICIKLSDAAGNITYGAGTGTFQSDFGIPAFTGVALTGASADGFINGSDGTGASNIVSAATGTNHTAAAYALALSATTCDIALTYGSIPKTNDAGFTADGTYKVCAKLTDTAGNTPAYGESGFVTVSTSGSISPATTVGPTTIISGTATDATSGISSVSISIQEGSGNCFSVASNDFTVACPAWIAATGTTSWTYTITDNVLLNGSTYNIETRAIDLAVSTGNIQTTLGSGSFSFVASEGADLWNDAIVYHYGSDDRPTASAMDSTGNLFVVGWHTVSDKNWMIKKFDRRGNEDVSVWNKDVGEAGSVEVARGVAIDSSNNLYVVGSRDNGSNLDWWLKKYSPAGVDDTLNWDIVLDGNSGNDEAMAVAVDTSSNVFVVGYGTNIAGGSTGEDIWIRKYSSAGVLGCEQKIDGGSASLGDRALSVVVNSATNKLYVAGYQTTAGPDQQMVVRRLRTSDCSIEVTATGNSAGASDQGAGVALDSSGNVYMSGRLSETDSDWWIRKYSAALVLQSEYNSGVAGSHEALSIALDTSNNIYLGGYKNGATNDWWLRQFNTSLTEDSGNWDKVIDAASGADQITSIAIGTGTSDVGAVYVIGW